MTRRRAWIPVVVVLGLSAYAAHEIRNAPLGLDYPGSTLDANKAGAPIRALVDGDIGRFMRVQPAMGSFSLLVRAVPAELARLDGPLPPAPHAESRIGLLIQDPAGFQSELRLYRLGLIPCFAALIALALVIVREGVRRDRPTVTLLVCAGLCVVNPLTSDAIGFGHPEEMIGAALCVAAIFLVAYGRAVAAGVAIGLAMATKQWALLALPIVVLAARGSRVRVLAATVGVVALLTVPLAIGDFHRFKDAALRPADVSATVKPQSIWWPVATPSVTYIFDGVKMQPHEHRALPDSIAGITHPLILATALIVALAYFARGREPRLDELLWLAALVFLLRALLDPITNAYYHFPFLLSLIAAEALAGGTLPVLSLLASVVLWQRVNQSLGDLTVQNLLYLSFAIPLAAWIALKLWRPDSAERIAGRLNAVRFRPSQLPG